MKIYTKTGDKGQTGLFGGKRVAKSHPRIEAYGTVDELNSYIGLIRFKDIQSHYQDVLGKAQNTLFDLGSILASDPDKNNLRIPTISESDIQLLEKEIDQMNEELPELRAFILPGGNDEVSFCHIARCVCRRAERLVVALSDIEQVEELTIRYLNRLSDYLFVLARKIGQDFGVQEVKWEANK